MTSAARTLAMIAAALAVVAVGACSGAAPPERAAYTPIEDPERARRALELAAEREALRPREPRHDLAIRIVGAAVAKLTPGSPSDTRARLPLENLDERVGTLEDAPPRAEPIDPEAARLYARTRVALHRDEPETALGFARRANELDPESSTIMLALADALAAAGDQDGASRAFVRAVDLGDRSVRALLANATAQDARESRRLRCAARAWDAAQRGSAAERVIAGTVLGRALMDAGYLAAGAAVLDASLPLIGPEAMRDTRYRRDLVRIATRRAELRTSVGDAWLTLERADRALTHYQATRSAVDRAPPALIGRIVAAHLSAGRPSLAALTLAEALETDPGIASPETRRWCRAIGSAPGIAPALADALGTRVLDASLAPSTRAVLLGHMLASAPGPDARIAMLGAAPIDLVDASMVRAAIEGPRQKCLDRAAALTDAAPALAPLAADALVRADERPIGLVKDLGERSTLLVRALAVHLGRPDLADDRSSAGPDDALNDDATRLAIDIALAALGGDAARASALAASATERTEDASAGASLTLIRALVATGRLDAARDAIDRLAAHAGDDAEVYHALAQAHALMGDAAARLAALRRAHELDPGDPRASERLVSLLAPRDNADGEGPSEELRAVVSGVNDRIPGSPLAIVLRANEMARRGLLAEAERAMVELHDPRPHREWGLDLMLSIWGTLADRGDDDALDRADAWFEERRDLAPGSADLGIAHARLLVLDGREDEAATMLGGLSERVGSRQAQRAHEGIVRRADQDRADELAIERLARRAGVEAAVERIAAASRLGVLSSLDAAAGLPDRDDVALLPVQTSTIVSALSARLERGRGDEDAVLAITRRARAMSTVADAELTQIQIVALAGSSSFTPDAFERLIREAPEGSAEQIVRIALQALARSGRSAQAPRLMARLSVEDGRVIPERIVDLAGLLGRDATPEAALSAVDELARLDAAGDAATILERELGTITRPGAREDRTSDQARADTLYAVAVLASFFDREDASMGMYRRVLAIDPDHVWALNDLGYQLVERRESLEEAHAMLVRASETLPASASVTDSLGWARYALGILRDEVDADGAMVRAGAVSLLERALTLEDGDENATIYDHLGDARWMSGDRDGAIAAWLGAERLLRERAKLFASSPDRDLDALGELQDRVRAVRGKITDAETGGSPDVAPSRATQPQP